MASSNLPKTSVAEQLAERVATLRVEKLPPMVQRKCEDLLIDVVGLCVTARNEDYIKSALAGCDDDGPCTAIGHARGFSAASAAFINGTAAHGEDFDDTFEGGPVHAGAVIVPAVLAACERHRPDGSAALLGIAVGSDVAMEVTTDAVQLLGGYGYTREFPVERMMRDAKITQIYEGTNQIQRIVISKRLLG